MLTIRYIKPKLLNPQFYFYLFTLMFFTFLIMNHIQKLVIVSHSLLLIFLATLKYWQIYSNYFLFIYIDILGSRFFFILECFFRTSIPLLSLDQILGKWGWVSDFLWRLFELRWDAVIRISGLPWLEFGRCGSKDPL